jgi:hypothetical protein
MARGCVTEKKSNLKTPKILGQKPKTSYPLPWQVLISQLSLYHIYVLVKNKAQLTQGSSKQNANSLEKEGGRVRRFGTWAHWSPLFKPLKNSNFKALKKFKKKCGHSQLYILRSWKFII